VKQGTIDLLNSERGVLCLLLVVASTIFVLVGKLAVADWISYTQTITIALVASKTVTGVVETMKNPKIPNATVVSEKS
jgi:hypothetical protein